MPPGTPGEQCEGNDQVGLVTWGCTAHVIVIKCLARTRKKGAGRTPGTKEWKCHSCTAFQAFRDGITLQEWAEGAARSEERHRVGKVIRVQDYMYSVSRNVVTCSVQLWYKRQMLETTRTGELHEYA